MNEMVANTPEQAETVALLAAVNNGLNIPGNAGNGEAASEEGAFVSDADEPTVPVLN
jgi:hypothetical protein